MKIVKVNFNKMPNLVNKRDWTSLLVHWNYSNGFAKDGGNSTVNTLGLLSLELSH